MKDVRPLDYAPPRPPRHRLREVDWPLAFACAILLALLLFILFVAWAAHRLDMAID